MRLNQILIAAVSFLLLSLAGCSSASATKADVAAVKTADEAWVYHDIVDVSFVQQYAKMPQPKGVMVIDSRPYMGKYILGHLPTAVSIPDSQFDKMTDKLPADKGTLLIFYCQGAS